MEATGNSLGNQLVMEEEGKGQWPDISHVGQERTLLVYQGGFPLRAGAIPRQ
jgi:hypothetical protein